MCLNFRLALALFVARIVLVNYVHTTFAAYDFVAWNSLPYG